MARHGSRVGRRRWPTGSASGFGRARVSKTRRRGGQPGRLQTPQSPSRLAHSRPHLPNSLRAPHSSPPPAASAAAPATRPASLAMVSPVRPTSYSRPSAVAYLVLCFFDGRICGGMGGMKHACSAWLGESALASCVAPRRVRADLRDSILAPRKDAESPYFAGDPLDGTWREYCNAYVESRSCLACNIFFLLRKIGRFVRKNLI